MSRSRRRSPYAVAAMAAGLLLGLALLATLRPGQVGGSIDAAPVQTAAKVGRDLKVVRPAPPAIDNPHEAPVSPAVVEGPAAVDTGAVPQESMVLVDVVDEDGRPAEGARVLPVDCPGFQRGPKRGAYIALPGPCTLRPLRKDGALFSRGPAETLTLRAGEIAYLQLELSGRRTGGIGVRFRPEHGGQRVLEVVPGTPAWEAGLEAGDLIVAVGDASVVGLGSDAFVEQMTGPEGTDVDFTISYSDEEGPVEESLRVTRQFLDG